MKIHKTLERDLARVLKNGVEVAHDKGNFYANFSNRLLNYDELSEVKTSIIALKSSGDRVSLGDEITINKNVYEVIKKEIYAEVNNRFYLREAIKKATL
ncbi:MULTISPECIES: hypothetical protein [unclassified Campylobacter]|uniref:hypothetical protein n=1 Tax=unclassified Campylobacter TaxID=2593542 RepID=UPI001BD9AE4B|nr:MULTISPECIES: hypothetical protein [unclassified Campylobacter]MBT0880167.1 hypothetical protein [Campylobacter sp. 2018MI27]MBT0884768.1 hypothetical protein [Campylobacter sp. 2018MI10]